MSIQSRGTGTYRPDDDLPIDYDRLFLDAVDIENGGLGIVDERGAK